MREAPPGARDEGGHPSGRSVLIVAGIAGLLGFGIGWIHPALQVAIESAQVLTLTHSGDETGNFERQLSAKVFGEGRALDARGEDIHASGQEEPALPSPQP